MKLYALYTDNEYRLSPERQLPGQLDRLGVWPGHAAGSFAFAFAFA